MAARLARDIPGAFKPDQYWNAENPAAHERTTGPELWEGTEGRITHFVASVGTGGTISGAGHCPQGRNPAIRVVGADPEGSVLSGDTARPYLTEGVGEDFLPGTYDPTVIDRWVRVSDRDAFAMARRLTREEGILSGGSCGTAMVAAREVVRDLVGAEGGAGGGHRGAAARQRPELPLEGLQRRVAARQRPDGHDRGGDAHRRSLLADRHHETDRPPVIVARTTERVGDAIATLQTLRDLAAPRVGGAGGRRRRRPRRLDQREEPARPGLSRPIHRRADRRRGHGTAAARWSRSRRRSTRRSPC